MNFFTRGASPRGSEREWCVTAARAELPLRWHKATGDGERQSSDEAAGLPAATHTKNKPWQICQGLFRNLSLFRDQLFFVNRRRRPMTAAPKPNSAIVQGSGIGATHPF